MRKPVLGFPTRPHTNQTVQPHKMARGLKFHIWEEDGSYFPYSENKGADQLRICKSLFSHNEAHIEHGEKGFENYNF